MHCVHPAPLAELLQVQPFFDRLFVLLGVVANLLAFSAFKFDAIVLRHRENLSGKRITNPSYYVNRLEPSPGFEPGTFTLQKCCSTTELRRRGFTLRLEVCRFCVQDKARDVGARAVLRCTATRRQGPATQSWTKIRRPSWWAEKDSNLRRRKAATFTVSCV